MLQGVNDKVVIEVTTVYTTVSSMQTRVLTIQLIPALVVVNAIEIMKRAWVSHARS